MVSFVVQYDKRVFDEFTGQVANAPTTLNIYSTTVIRKAVEEYVVRKLVTAPVPAPSYPLRWKSPKQRKYVMAKLRKEGNWPYRRSGAFQRAWKVAAIRERNSSLIAVSNNSGITEYIAGSSAARQPMFDHWYHYEDTLLKAESLATDLAINAWYDIVTYGEVQAGSLRVRAP